MNKLLADEYVYTLKMHGLASVDNLIPQCVKCGCVDQRRVSHRSMVSAAPEMRGIFAVCCSKCCMGFTVLIGGGLVYISMMLYMRQLDMLFEDTNVSLPDATAAVHQAEGSAATQFPAPADA